MAATVRFALVFACSGFLVLSLACSNAQEMLVSGERNIIASDSTELYLKVAGNGPVCLFVHGGPGQGTLSFEEMGGDSLENFLTMVYLDQRGSGKSQDADDYHLGRVLQDMEEARQSLGVEEWCVIAHSFGGILAVDYAERYPKRVSRLVLANITLQFLGPAHNRMQIDFVNRVLDRKVIEVPVDADPARLAEARQEARAALMRSGSGYRFLTEDVESIQVMSEIDGSYERTTDFGNTIIEQREAYPEYYTDYASISAEISQPTLVITGRKDFAVGPNEYRRFRFPNQKTVVLDGGHLPYFENNPSFTTAIRDFMTGEEP